jgi:hypothetical protein
MKSEQDEIQGCASHVASLSSASNMDEKPNHINLVTSIGQSYLFCCVLHHPLQHILKVEEWLTAIRVNCSHVGRASTSKPLDFTHSISIGLRISKPTSTITLLRRYRSRTLSRFKATAPSSAISVRCARSGNKLCSSSLCSRCGRRGRCRFSWYRLGRNSRWARICCSFGGGESIVVGLSVAETTSFAALVCDERGRTLSGCETAAGGGALSIRSACSCNELRALRSDV